LVVMVTVLLTSLRANGRDAGGVKRGVEIKNKKNQLGNGVFQTFMPAWRGKREGGGGGGGGNSSLILPVTSAVGRGGGNLPKEGKRGGGGSVQRIVYRRFHRGQVGECRGGSLGKGKEGKGKGKRNRVLGLYCVYDAFVAGKREKVGGKGGAEEARPSSWRAPAIELLACPVCRCALSLPTMRGKKGKREGEKRDQ